MYKHVQKCTLWVISTSTIALETKSNILELQPNTNMSPVIWPQLEFQLYIPCINLKLNSSVIQFPNCKTNHDARILNNMSQGWPFKWNWQVVLFNTNSVGLLIFHFWHRGERALHKIKIPENPMTDEFKKFACLNSLLYSVNAFKRRESMAKVKCENFLQKSCGRGTLLV